MNASPHNRILDSYAPSSLLPGALRCLSLLAKNLADVSHFVVQTPPHPAHFSLFNSNPHHRRPTAMTTSIKAFFSRPDGGCDDVRRFKLDKIDFTTLAQRTATLFDVPLAATQLKWKGA
jgi:hypothetical protein